MSSEQTCLACGSRRDTSIEQRQADLIAELRRQLAVLLRQNDRLRAEQEPAPDSEGER